jgi:deoxyribodipyrimidine photolyase
MKIEIRRNRTISFTCTCKPADGILNLIPKMPEEFVRKNQEYDERKKAAEERIWKAVEESDIEVRDCSGKLVRRETHEICWEETGEKEEIQDGIFFMKLRPYIQPIKSEYQP